MGTESDSPCDSAVSRGAQRPWGPGQVAPMQPGAQGGRLCVRPVLRVEKRTEQKLEGSGVSGNCRWLGVAGMGEMRWEWQEVRQRESGRPFEGQVL